MPQVPLLVVSDAITSPTGLGRITRELAIRVHKNMGDVFRLGTLGYGGNVSRKFPWQQYTIRVLDNWKIPELPYVWNDFAGDEKGIILCIWNASWLPWFADPTLLPDGDLKAFLQSRLFKKWGYFPIDAEGLNGRLDESQGKIMVKFDRVATYTKWASCVIGATCQKLVKSPFGLSCSYLPHGTDGNTFHPRNRQEARRDFITKIVPKGKGSISDEVLLIGVCATNTERKYWPIAFQVCAELVKRGMNVGLWAHTDSFQKAWNLFALADECDMRQRVIFTNGNLSDEDLAWGYAACDLTLGIGLGEGWGLPISESLACGIPCVTGDYAGAAEFTPAEFKVKPVGYHYEGFYSNKRPVFDVADWVLKVRGAIGRRVSLDPQYLWDNCWPKWEEWLRDGLK